MQVGDLVQLSAAGKKLNSNYLIGDNFGIIKAIRPDKVMTHYPYTVFWFGFRVKGAKYVEKNSLYHSRRELKHYSKHKESK